MNFQVVGTQGDIGATSTLTTATPTPGVYGDMTAQTIFGSVPKTTEEGDHSYLSSFNSVLSSDYSVASPIFQSLVSVAATANSSLQSQAASNATSLRKSLSMAVSSERSALSSAQSSLQSSADNLRKITNSAFVFASPKLILYLAIAAIPLVTSF